MLQFDGEEAADLTNRYLWANAVDQILADEQVTTLSSAGDVYWPLTDHQGTVRQLAFYDAGSGDTTIQRYWEYDSFGNVTSETAAAVDHLFGYTGRAFDDETGLQNNLHRWFDPVTGRWASEDPIGFAAGDANLYRYVGNFSTGAIDPRGELWWLLIIPLAGTIALIPDNSGEEEYSPEADFGSSLIPGVETARDVVELATGEDAFSGEPFTPFDYAVTTACLFAPIGGAFMRKLLKGAGSYIDDAGEAVLDHLDEAAETGNAARKGAEEAADVGDTAEDIARAMKQADSKGKRVPISGGTSKPAVEDQGLQKALDRIYKGADGPDPIGTGSLQDAARHEALTGMKTKGKFHYEALNNAYKNLSDRLKKDGKNWSEADRCAAQGVLEDMRDALSQGPGKAGRTK